jgi:hypothetical protein
MAISGLVLTTDTASSASLLAGMLAGQSGIEVGEQRGNRLAIVIDVDHGEDEQAFDRLRLMPGVADIAIACIHFTDVNAEA